MVADWDAIFPNEYTHDTAACRQTCWLKSGAVEAAMISTEFSVLVRRDGFREIADVASMGLNFPTSALVTSRSFIKRSENTVRKFIRGFVERIHYAKTQREFQR